MGSEKTQVTIIRRQPEKIRESILHQMDRGVPVLQAEGGYLHENTPVSLSVIANRELPYVERLVRAVDPEAFMIVSRVTEVRGRGFSMKKEYR